MYLIADIGNSRIKLGCFFDSYNPYCYFTSYHIKDEIISILTKIKENQCIEKIFFCSVKYDFNTIFCDCVREVFNIEAYMITHRDINLKDNLYEPENAVGIDRILSTFASICIEGNTQDKYASLVVDMGTATTISVMLSDFVFLGGLIMSGTKTSSLALSEKTSLPYYEIEHIDSIPSPIMNNVKDALITGSIYNTIGSIMYTVNSTKEYIKEKYNIPVKIFLTGGISNLNLLQCKVYPYLVLQGIYFTVSDNK